MKAFKSAQADVKEKMQNVGAKVEEMTALNKASATAKAERLEAANKAGKHDAKANYHTKQAEILREYEQKKTDNAAEKEQTKTALHQKKADKHTNKADKHATATGEQRTTAPAATSGISPTQSDVQEPISEAREEESTGMTARNAYAPGIPAELGDRNTSTPAVSDARERAREEDTNATNPVDSASSDPVQHSEIPMHGSGVPTHSTLHSNSSPGGDTHDIRTTQTMEGSSNTGSYM